MRGLNGLSRLRIGTKLGMLGLVGVVLVAGMIVNEQITTGMVQELNAESSRQRSIAIEIANTEIALRWAQVTGRDMLMARSAEQVEAAVAALDNVAEVGSRSLAKLVEQARDTKNRSRIDSVRAEFNSFVAALADIGKLRSQILTLFSRREQTERNWGNRFNIALNSSAMTLAENTGELEGFLNSANLGFNDARTAAWRYVVLDEEAQHRVIDVSVNYVAETIGFAKRATKDATNIKNFDRLAETIAEFDEVLKETLSAISLQNTIRAERSSPAETEARRLLTEVSQTSKRLSDVALQDVETGQIRAGRIRLAFGVVVVMLLLGSAVIASVTIGRPISRIGHVLMALVQGNKATEIPYIHRGDEVGDNARAAKAFRDSLLRMEQLEAERRQVEEGAVAQRKQAMSRLADEFEMTVGGIVGTVSSASARLEGAAGTLTNAAETTRERVSAAADASNETSGNVQSVAAATVQLSASIEEISRKTDLSNQIASSAVGQASVADRRINELSQVAERIGDVVKLITDITEQTNLLALNATIEAARAGMAGRGFAVVAQEVKVLANQTAKAAGEIATQISDIQSGTLDSVAAIKQVSATIGHMSEIASSISAAVTEQGYTMQEIARNMQKATDRTNQIASNIADVNRGASDTGMASAQVLELARSLSQENQRLRAEVQKFLATVRAA